MVSSSAMNETREGKREADYTQLWLLQLQWLGKSSGEETQHP